MGKSPFLCLLVALFLVAASVRGRFISEFPPDLISDGLKHVGRPSFLRLGSLSASQTCEQTYGFLPCTSSVLGNLFLAIVYGYLMFEAATCLATGSELLLTLLGPGIIGGLFLPILGALPDAILILVSGLSGSKEIAQDQVLIGMGLLSGSTVMLLTALWGSCIVVGKVNLADGSASTGCDLYGSGVTTDQQTSHAAKIMIISVIPFLIVQVPKIFHLSSGSRLVVLISLIVSIVFLVSYCIFQVYQPWIQGRRLAYAKRKHVISGLLRHLHRESLGKLLTIDGEPNIPLIKKLFKRIDVNSDGVASANELRSLVIGIQFVGENLDPDEAVDKMMDEFDTSNDKVIDEKEFVTGICDWIHKAKNAVSYKGEFIRSVVSGYHEMTKVEYDTLLDASDEVVEIVDNPTWVITKAVFLLFLGTVIAAVSADPLVDAVDNFSGATGIPSFFISFIAMPLATNSSEAVSALIFASRKKERSSSLTFSEIYGAVTMNNTLCLAVFLGLVYVRQLTWDFSAEVLVILVVSVVMGLFASFRTKFPLWTSAVAFALYPLSLILVYLLDYVFGWS
ncbi:sodium/calcium exchanger NCL1-like [Aristolochia californica]|uniref:sodium/calcium exchanger NCL1-like n=1 Tax=Aristolochia californica TaxID=171875 RepID=UPI0035DF9868